MVDRLSNATGVLGALKHLQTANRELGAADSPLQVCSTRAERSLRPGRFWAAAAGCDQPCQPLQPGAAFPNDWAEAEEGL